MGSAVTGFGEPGLSIDSARFVFMSLNEADRSWRDRFAELLQSRGVEVWDELRLQAEGIPAARLDRVIANSSVAVLLVSPRFLSSEFLKSQLQVLLTQKKPLYPVMVEHCDWQSEGLLRGVRMFPTDGRALLSVAASELESYLTLAVLEIVALSGIISIAELAAAKISDSSGRFVGMATLVNQGAAIGIFPEGTNEKSLNVEFPNMGFTTVGQPAVFADQPRLTLLQLSQSVDWPVLVGSTAPPAGAVWECWSIPAGSEVGGFTTGTILGTAQRNGREYLQLKPSVETERPRGMSGAAIVVNGYVVAILESQGAILDEWFAVSIQSVSTGAIWDAAFRPNLTAGATAAPQATSSSNTISGSQSIDSIAESAANIPPPTQSGTSASVLPPPQAADESEVGLGSFLERLTPEALSALLRAEGYRVALGQGRMHMEHLLLGLYGQPDSPLRRLAREAKIYDEASLQRSLSAANPRLTGQVKPALQSVPLTLPQLSAHVRQALIAAQTSGGTRIGRRALLDGALSVDCGALRGLRSQTSNQQAPEGSVVERNWLPEVTSDVAGARDEDLLNLHRDVNALCSVIAAADAALPLSIGLFGDWGSGKSFFMNMMEARLEELQGQQSFCSKIIQLKFNAWHYMDTSLWASLTSEIFEGLATKLSTSPGPEPPNTTAKLLADVSTSRDKLAEAELQSEAAKLKLAESEARLQELEREKSVSARKLFITATRLAFEQEEVRGQLDEAAKALNLPKAIDEGTEVNRELVELRGIFSAIFVAMRNTEKLWIWLSALALMITAVFGIPLLVERVLPDQWNSLKTLVETASAIVGSIAALLTPFFFPAMRALKFLREARATSEKLLREETERKTNKLKEEQEKRKAELTQRDEEVRAERQKLEVLEAAIEQLRADRQMLDFIKRRNASSDYTSHLGVIARAHKDFRELSTFLERVAKEPENKSKQQPDLPRVDRIVLYIDDLDRCPEEKVMDVLQAVHLLLAFPLFVVVVGVDPRWLLHSVAARSPALRKNRVGAEEFGESTPLDYLEKIFQIPFTLSPMSATGFYSLVDKVAGTKPRENAKREPLSSPQPQDRGEGATTHEVRSTTKVVLQKRVSSETATSPPAEARNLEAAGGVEPVTIEPWEREYMKKLYCLIPSPRAGKRFINIYRMIRSTLDGERWKTFVGDPTHGDHRQALLLLAILTGYPGEAAEILRRLIERVHNETWWEFVDSLNFTDDKWAELRMKLQSLRPLIAETEGCDTFRRFAPSVARYSFQSGRVLLAQQLPEADT